MKKYSHFTAIPLSFFSKDLYRDVGQSWRGIAFWYLVLILALTWIPTMVYMHNGINSFVKNDAPTYVNKLPEITIKDGNLSIDKPTPYYINDQKTGDNFVVIDPNGDIAVMQQSAASILVTKNQVYIKKQNGETRVIQIPKDSNYQFGPSQVQNWLGKMAGSASYVLYPFLLFGSIIGRLIQALIYAGIAALFFNKFSETKLEYQGLLRLNMVAITPAMILSTVLGVMSIRFPFQLLVYFLITMGYLYFAVKSNRMENND